MNHNDYGGIASDLRVEDLVVTAYIGKFCGSQVCGRPRDCCASMVDLICFLKANVESSWIGKLW